MSIGQDLSQVAAELGLFADLTAPQLKAAAHTFDELWFNAGQRVLRQGFAQPDFFVIIEGEAAVRIGTEETARLQKGDFFGEISVLLDEPPTADVVALTPLRCLSLAGADVQRFLVAFPQVMFRMLQVEAARLRNAIRWRT